MILSELTSPLGAMLLATDEHGRVRSWEFAERRSRLHRSLLEQYGTYELIAGPAPPAVLRGSPRRARDERGGDARYRSAAKRVDGAAPHSRRPDDNVRSDRQGNEHQRLARRPGRGFDGGRQPDRDRRAVSPATRQARRSQGLRMGTPPQAVAARARAGHRAPPGQAILIDSEDDLDVISASGKPLRATRPGPWAGIAAGCCMASSTVALPRMRSRGVVVQGIACSSSRRSERNRCRLPAMCRVPAPWKLAV